MGYAITIFGFMFLILFHELGHFLVAKIVGVRVEKFSIGFGKRLFSKRVGETEYMLSIVPLGGFVKLFGETDQEEISANDKKYAFYVKPLWARASIVAAGPIFNVLFSIIVFILLSAIGSKMTLPIIGAVTEGMPAQIAGVQPGDRVKYINGHEIRIWGDISKTIKQSTPQTITIEVDRNGHEFVFSVKPQLKEKVNSFGEKVNVPLIGISSSGDIGVVRYGLFESVLLGFERTAEVTYLTLQGLKNLVFGTVPASNITGPIGIVRMAQKTVNDSISRFITLIAIISINLAILNMLPIPVLDGGHLMMYSIEAVRRKPLSLSVQDKINRLGFAFIIFLMVFACINDFKNFIF